MTTRAYKLFTLRKDGTLGPLFINKRQRVPVGEWLRAEDHPTKGFAHRPGWHAALKPVAPHLSENGRVWCEVKVAGVQRFRRPEHQGGVWILAQLMKVEKILKVP